MSKSTKSSERLTGKDAAETNFNNDREEQDIKLSRLFGTDAAIFDASKSADQYETPPAKPEMGMIRNVSPESRKSPLTTHDPTPEMPGAD